MSTIAEKSYGSDIAELLEALGMSRMDYDRFRHGCPIDFDKCAYDSQLGKYIARVKREIRSSGVFPGDYL